MAKKYKRYYEIPVRSCDEDCPGRGEKYLKITLFHKYRKLRSHAVKHLANREERRWSTKLKADAATIDRCITDLQNINCPYFTAKLPGPPCNECLMFNKCNSFVVKLENEYLRIIQKAIKDGCSRPRYACFIAKMEKGDVYVFCTMPDQPVITKSALLDEVDAVYNLMTAYSARASVSFSEMLKKQRDKIINESTKNSIKWCNAIAWGFTPLRRTGAEANRKERQTKSRKFSKTGKGNWRKFLQEMDYKS